VAEYDLHTAKTHFSRLIKQVEADEEVIISRAGKPVAFGGVSAHGPDRAE